MRRRRLPASGVAALTSALLHLAAAAAIIAVGSENAAPTLMPAAIPVNLVLETSPASTAAAPVARPAKPAPALPVLMPSLPPVPFEPAKAERTRLEAAAAAISPVAAGLPALAEVESAPPAATVSLPVPEPRRKPQRTSQTAALQEPKPIAATVPPNPIVEAAAEPAPATYAPAASRGAPTATAAAVSSALAASPNRFVAAALGPNNPKPAYPVLARRRGLQGRVVVRAEVLPDGQSGKVTILSSSGSGLLDHAAEDAVRHWRFVPARAGDRPVPAELDVPVVFQLND